MSRGYAILIFLIVAGTTSAAMAPNRDKYSDSYSNLDGRGVCYGHDFSGVSLALKDTVVVLNGAQAHPTVFPEVEPPKMNEQVRERIERIREFAEELRVRRREMIANTVAVADIRAEMVARLNQSNLVVPGSVKHRDYHSKIGEDHIWVQYKGENSRTLLVFSYSEPEPLPSREEILEVKRANARKEFELLKAYFEKSSFVVISSGCGQSFAPEIVDEVLDELSRIRNRQTMPTRAEWNMEKRFFNYRVVEQILVPLDWAAFRRR